MGKRTNGRLCVCARVSMNEWRLACGFFCWYTYIAGVVELSIFHFFTVRSLRQSHRWMLMMNFNSTNFRLSRERERATKRQSPSLFVCFFLAVNINYQFTHNLKKNGKTKRMTAGCSLKSVTIKIEYFLLNIFKYIERYRSSCRRDEKMCAHPHMDFF